jgi:anti-sigma factor RsiW
MNQNPLSHDDPRLTAYAFNEMSATERDEFEKLLQSDPHARQAVDEIRAAGALLSGALETEPIVASAPVTAPGTKRPTGAAKLLHFPQFY